MSTATIFKNGFFFEAAHCLKRLPEDHICHRMHGHSYQVELELCGPIDRRGFVADYDDLVTAWEPIREELDHTVLNEVPGLEVPSTEIVAMWIMLRMGWVSDRQPGHITLHQASIMRRVGTMLQSVTVFESNSTRSRATRASVGEIDPDTWASLSAQITGAA